MPDVRISTNDLLFRLDGFQEYRNKLHLNAWLVHRKERLTHVTIFVNSKPWVRRVELTIRSDVWQSIRHIAQHSIHSGLAVAASIDSDQINGLHDYLQIVALQGSREIGIVTLAVRDFARESERLPIPPDQLAERAGGHISFLETGLRIYNDIKTRVEMYRSFGCFDTVLDWGCGCGRIMRYALEDFPGSKLNGCDIDDDAISWDKQSLPGPSFSKILAFPPTSYSDESFDLIYGISIFTHLTESAQNSWLAELQRICRKGGIVAVSVLGEFMAPAELRPVIRRDGIADVLSPQSEEFAPHSDNSYYRVTYHSKQYVLQHWSQYFDILEYSEFGVNSHQDLVIMKRKDSVSGT